MVKTPEMRVLLRAVAAVLALAICLNGCGGQDARLQEKLEEAFSHLQKSSQHIKGLEGFEERWKSAVSGEDEVEPVGELAEMLEDAKATEESALAELEQGEDTLGQALRMPASEEMKRYLRLKLDAVGEQGKALEAELEAMKVRLDMLDDPVAGVAPDSETVRKMRLVSELEGESKGHADEAARLDREANDYYESKKL
jgi:hypothetical protein